MAFFPSKMATLRNKRKLAAVTRETQEEHSRSGQSQNTSVPRINEEYITQLSEELEGRVTKKLSQEFSRTASRILGALSKLDEFLLSQQIQTHSETVPGTFRKTNVENLRTNEDDSQSDPHPEGGLFRSQTTQKSGPEVGHYRKLILRNLTSEAEMPFQGKNNFPAISVLIKRVFSIFRRKMDRTYPSEMDIKLVILASTSHLTNTVPFLSWKMEKNLNNSGNFWKNST